MAITRLVLASVFAALTIATPAVAAPDTERADRMIWTREGDGVVDGPADTASLAHPLAMVAAGGGDLLVGDMGANAIRRYDAASRQLETIAGNDDGDAGFSGDGGPFRQARFDFPIALAHDERGVIYVSDFDNQRIRALNPTGQPVTVGAVRIAPGSIETIAGNGEITEFPHAPADAVDARDTSMAWPRGLAVDAAGNVFYADVDNLMVRVIWNSGPQAGKVETYAGRGWPDDFDLIDYPADHGDGGPARDMILAFPSAVTIGPDGDLYVAEWGYSTPAEHEVGVVWRIDHDDRTAHRVAGNTVAAFGGDGGPARDAGLVGNIQSLVFDAQGNLYISDWNAIRRVDADTGVITTYAGRDEEFIPTFSASDAGAPAAGATIAYTGGMAWSDGGLAFVDADAGVVRRVDGQGVLRDVIRARSGLKRPYAMSIDGADRLFLSEWAHGRIRRLDPDGSLATAVNLPDNGGTTLTGPALSARSGPSNGIAFDERGDLYFSDTGNSRILQVRATPGPGGRQIRDDSPIREIARLAAPFAPLGAIVDHLVAHAGKVYFTEIVSGSVIELDLRSGARRTVAGGDGSFGELGGIALDPRGGRLYVADSAAGRIVAVDIATGAVSHLADLPYEHFANVHMAMSGSLLFASNDWAGSQVLVIDTGAREPVAEVYAGAEQPFMPNQSGDGGPARAAMLGEAAGIAVDSAGKLQIAERETGRVRVVGTSDLLPGVFPNVIRRNSAVLVDIAIASNPEFDARELVGSSVSVAGIATRDPRVRDVDRDGRPDLVVRVRERDLAAAAGAGAREVAIEGRLRGGGMFRDADWVSVRSTAVDRPKSGQLLYRHIDPPAGRDDGDRARLRLRERAADGPPAGLQLHRRFHRRAVGFVVDRPPRR